jgi:hypothetical protein
MVYEAGYEQVIANSDWVHDRFSSPAPDHNGAAEHNLPALPCLQFCPAQFDSERELNRKRMVSDQSGGF